MKTHFIAAVSLLFSASGAGAAPLAANALTARVAGAEFRGYFSNGGFFENHIWRLAPDGAARAVYDRRRGAGQHGMYFEAGQDTGRWSVEGDRLCVQFAVLFLGQKRCYSVMALQGSQVRLSGPESIEGTLSH